MRLYRWLVCPDVPVHPPYCRAVRFIRLAGQRVENIATLHVDQWKVAEWIIDWSTTKSMRAHAILLPSLAARFLEQIKPNQHGWFFPSAEVPSRSISHNMRYCLHLTPARARRHPARHQPRPAPHLEDARRQAGLTNEIRDRIQNRTLQDVSSKSYGRWTDLPEKREGMDRRDRFIRGMLTEGSRRAGSSVR